LPVVGEARSSGFKMFRTARQPEVCQRRAMQHRNRVAGSFNRFKETATALTLCFDAVPKGKRYALSRENRTLFLELLS